MKNTIGIITLLLVSQSGFAEENQTNAIEASQTEPRVIESDAAVIDQAPVINTTATETAETIKEQSGFSQGSVVRSAFTRDIEDREPTEDLQKLTNENGQVKFFTELRDMNGQTATHRWEYEGKVVAEVAFNVKGPRWRVWSSKSFVPQWTGDWKVSVLNGAGEIISEKKLSYDVASAPAEAIPATNTEANPAMTEPTTVQENMQ